MKQTAESVRLGAVAPCVGGMRAVSGPGRVSGRSARRLGRAGCRRGGGEGPGRVAGFGRGTVLQDAIFIVCIMNSDYERTDPQLTAVRCCQAHAFPELKENPALLKRIAVVSIPRLHAPLEMLAPPLIIQAQDLHRYGYRYRHRGRYRYIGLGIGI